MEGETQVTESAPVVTEAPIETQVTETPAEQPTEAKPEGFDKVEFTPEQLARVNRIYGNMKRYEGDFKQQKELNDALVREFQTLRQEQSQIVNHLQNSDYKDAETALSQQRTEAWNKGDLDAYNTANDKINQIRIDKGISDKLAKSQVRPQPQQQGVNGNQVVDRATSQGVLTHDEANITRAWMEETDPMGNFKRPWASDPSDPKNYAAALEAQAVFNSPLYASKPISEKLKEVDRRMGIQTQAPRSNVLPAGNLTNGIRTNTIKLDPAIEKIAIRTKFGGPKAKSDQDHIDAWKKAVAKSKGAN